MNPRLEARALESLDNIVANVEALRPYLELSMQIDDQPHNGDGNDKNGKLARRLADKVIAIDLATKSLIKVGKDIATKVDEAAERQASISDCLACGEPALPRPVRGLCSLTCYEHFRYWASKHPDNPDIAIWLAEVKNKQMIEDMANDLAGEFANINGDSTNRTGIMEESVSHV